MRSPKSKGSSVGWKRSKTSTNRGTAKPGFRLSGFAVEDFRGVVLGRIGLAARRVFRHIAFSRSQEQVLLDAVLLGIEIEVPAAQFIKRLVCPAFHDLSTFHHKYLVGAPNRRESVGDHERRASLHQGRQSALDQRF